MKFSCICFVLTLALVSATTNLKAQSAPPQPISACYVKVPIPCSIISNAENTSRTCVNGSLTTECFDVIIFDESTCRVLQAAPGQAGKESVITQTCNAMLVFQQKTCWDDPNDGLDVTLCVVNPTLVFVGCNGTDVDSASGNCSGFGVK